MCIGGNDAWRNRTRLHRGAGTRPGCHPGVRTQPANHDAQRGGCGKSFTGESSSLAQLDGSDIVYVARVAVPKIITLAVTIGTRFPALQTSLGKVLLAELPQDELERVLAEPSRSGITPLWQPDAEERDRVLNEVRTRGWSLTDEHLARGIRSIAAPVRDGTHQVVAALNVTVHAAETSIEILTEKYLPMLLQTAAAISADWALWQCRPQITSGGRTASAAP